MFDIKCKGLFPTDLYFVSIFDKKENESYKQEPLIIFKMLFSYDEFDKFHKVLCNIYKKQV